MSCLSQEDTPKRSLFQQYGGIHTGDWVDHLPSSWVPYVQLSRLSPSVGLLLIYLPHIFGVCHAAIIHDLPLGQFSRACAVLLCGSFFCNNASHAWNDIVDAPIDERINRTRNRPIPRGAITIKAAFIFATSQAIGAAAALLLLPRATIRAAIFNIIGTLYYPYAKRHSHFPQVVLGVCLTWGVMIGSSAMGVGDPWFDMSTACLFLGSVMWVIIYDTVYAHQDLVDDLRVGVKSTAVRFQGETKRFLWVLLTCMGALLSCSGYHGSMGLPYYLVSLGGSLSSVAVMVASVNLDDASSCWGWFAAGFPLTGTCIATGLLVEYIIR